MNPAQPSEISIIRAKVDHANSFFTKSSHFLELPWSKIPNKK